MTTRRRLAGLGASLGLALAPLAAAHAQTAPACDRACLKGFMDAYVAAQAAHDVSGLSFASDVRVTENGVVMAPGEGFFETAGAPSYWLEIYDPETGGAAAEMVVAEGDHAAFEFLRLKVVDGAISEVETVIAREGDSGPLFVPDFATAPRSDFQLSIRPAEQNSRLELMAAADAYWRALETNGWPEYHPAPLLPGTVRIENGLATTSGSLENRGAASPAGPGGTSAPEQFNTGAFKNRTIYDRRFPVVDVERGVVLSIARMGLKPGETETPPHWKGGNPILCEMFAIQEGKIISVEVVMNSTIPIDRSAGWPRSPLTRSIGDP